MRQTYLGDVLHLLSHLLTFTRHTHLALCHCIRLLVELESGLGIGLLYDLLLISEIWHRLIAHDLTVLLALAQGIALLADSRLVL